MGDRCGSLELKKECRSGRERGQARDRGCLASSDWWARVLVWSTRSGLEEELKGSAYQEGKRGAQAGVFRGHKDGCGGRAMLTGRF